MKIGLLVMAVIGAFPAWAGFEVGNGGTVVYCESVPGAKWTGYHTYEYLISATQGREPHASRDMGQSVLVDIQIWLDHAVSSQAARFRDFLAAFESQEVVGGYRWVRTQGTPLLGARGYYPTRSFPNHCRSPAETAVLRREILGEVEYLWDPELLNALASSPVNQLHWLLVHEWLRDFKLRDDQILSVVQYFHSQAFLNALNAGNLDQISDEVYLRSGVYF